jgi:glutathione S-transferase
MATGKRGIAMKLHYTMNLNPRVAVAVAQHLKSPLDCVRAAPFGPDRPTFLMMNPNGLVPVLEESDRTLWETDAIALRLSRLSGTDFWPDGQSEEVVMWLSWSAHHFTQAGSTLYFENIVGPRFMGREPDARRVAGAVKEFRRFGKLLDGILGSRDWLVGGRLSYADFRVASALPFADRSGAPLGEFPNVSAWHDRLNQLDAWREPFAGLD